MPDPMSSPWDLSTKNSVGICCHPFSLRLQNILLARLMSKMSKSEVEDRVMSVCKAFDKIVADKVLGN